MMTNVIQIKMINREETPIIPIMGTVKTLPISKQEENSSVPIIIQKMSQTQLKQLKKGLKRIMALVEFSEIELIWNVREGIVMDLIPIQIVMLAEEPTEPQSYEEVLANPFAME
ncbi:hypothetical protein QAD02_001874 [Eretmocerus hayati]|uniref:Uncharacterized protein n=1 Tax=Eretmocerus hayati TaxID=131215 RepID=A0ACC2NHD2_9HYME|nr:hypothetical protein QAD02_001874 [Eretmocerus hayati]